MESKIKTLFIQHTSVLGGSSKSMLELIDNLPENVEPTVLCPSGKLGDLLNKKNIKVHNVIGIPQFDNTRIGCYRNIRWLILLRELFYLPFFIYKLFALKKEKFDIVHVNEITQIYSIIFAKMLFSQVVVHVRSLQSTQINIRYRLIYKIIETFADAIIAIDETVKSSIKPNPNIYVIHNGMSPKNIIWNKVKQKKFTVAIVSNFQRYKGIIDFIDAASICINHKKLNIQFMIFGASYETKRSFKQYFLHLTGFRENLDELIKEKINTNNLNTRIELLGFVENANDIYNRIDLLTFPSHLNAVGRPVFEAAFYYVPSIVAVQNTHTDTIIDGVTGICINEKNPQQLADSIEIVYTDRDLLLNMGQQSFILATNLYNSTKNSTEVYNLYLKLIRN